jgi:hypothetical protein
MKLIKRLMTFCLTIAICTITTLSLLNNSINKRIDRQQDWIELISVPYMKGIYLAQECFKDVVFDNRLPIIERSLQMSSSLKRGSVINIIKKCDESDKHWRDYTKSRNIYLLKWVKRSK